MIELENGLLEYDEDVADILYTTLNDRLLQHWCVGNYDHEELVIDMRARLFKKGLAPEEVVSLANRIKQNPVKGENPETIFSAAGVVTDANSDTLLFIFFIASSKFHVLGSSHIARLFYHKNSGSLI